MLNLVLWDEQNKYHPKYTNPIALGTKLCHVRKNTWLQRVHVDIGYLELPTNINHAYVEKIIFRKISPT